jgi:hypothetical protein
MRKRGWFQLHLLTVGVVVIATGGLLPIVIAAYGGFKDPKWSNYSDESRRIIFGVVLVCYFGTLFYLARFTEFILGELKRERDTP